MYAKLPNAESRGLIRNIISEILSTDYKIQSRLVESLCLVFFSSSYYTSSSSNFNIFLFLNQYELLLVLFIKWLFFPINVIVIFILL